MNCPVFLAVLAAFVSLLLAPDSCQALPDSQCDLDDCAASCTELGAMRWSCELEGCLCTFLVEDAKSLELGEEVEGQGQGGRDKGRPKKKGTHGKNKHGSGKEEGASNTTNPPAGQQTTQGLTPATASSHKDQGHKNGTATGGQSDKDNATSSESPQTSKKPDEKHSSKDNAGQKDMGTMSLLSRLALEPDSGGKRERYSDLRGRTAAEKSSKNMPFLVRSLERPLSQQQVMSQLRKQKGDIPMKKIEEFIMKG